MGRFERGLAKIHDELSDDYDIDPAMWTADLSDRTDENGAAIVIGIHAGGVTDIGTIDLDELATMDGLA